MNPETGTTATAPVSRQRTLDDAAALYRALLGRPIDDGARDMIVSFPTPPENLELALRVVMSPEFLTRLTRNSIAAHLHLIHRARQIMVRRLLPAADRVIDLGGANAPLFTFGWSHRFTHMVLVDLPPDERHEMYKDVVIKSPTDCGEVSIQYGDMTRLERYADESFDLVFSGESIEHVDLEGGKRMIRQAFRVLRPGGHFCLDTPNRGLTEIHTRSVGGGFIHPEHKHEYRAQELRDLLRAASFEIPVARGVCEMPKTRATGEFHYEDFVLGNPLTEDPEDGYLLYFGCRKPAR
jgi:SAM-dependent methyltransferase